MARPVPTKVGRNGKTKPVGAAGKNPRPRAKTEEKAKGLIGWKNGKKDTSYNGPKVGNYKGKSLNLTAAQLKKAGVKKASTLKTVNISDTRFDKKLGQVVSRTTGKPIRGKMDMGGGNIAVYKNGKRVNLTKPKAAGARSVSRPSSSRSTTTTTASKGNKGKGLTPKQKAAMGYGPKGRTPSNLGNNAGAAGRRPTAAASGYQAGANGTGSKNKGVDWGKVARGAAVGAAGAAGYASPLGRVAGAAAGAGAAAYQAGKVIRKSASGYAKLARKARGG